MMIVRVIIEFLTSLLPAFTMPAEVLGAFSEVASWAYVVNYYVPLATFVSCLNTFFIVWIGSAFISTVLQLL